MLSWDSVERKNETCIMTLYCLDLVFHIPQTNRTHKDIREARVKAHV